MTDYGVTRSDVATYVEWLTFMPGWTFAVLPWQALPVEGMCVVRIMRKQPDTSYPPNYDNDHNDLRWAREVMVDLAQVSTMNDVGHIILTACIDWLNDADMNEHEAREFFRVHVGTNRETDTGPENWHAIFHPHVLSGDREWKRQQEASAGRYLFVMER